MMRKHAIVLVFTFLFLGMMFASVETPYVSPNKSESAIQESPEIYDQIAEEPVPEEPLRLNVIENPSYEDWNDGSHSPEGWYTQSSAHQYSDRAYTSDVANGSYAGYMEGMGGNVSYANTYLYVRPRAPITEALIEPGISLRFNWKVQSLPDLQIGSEVYVYVVTRDGVGGSHYFFYYLSTASTYTTTLTNARISVNDTIGQWNSFNRNITEDFIDEFGAGALTTTHYIDYLWFYVSSPAEATGMASAVIDDVVLYNTTYTDWIENGNFETGAGSPWVYYYSSLGHVQQSTDSTLGSYSTKVTVPSVMQGSGWARCFMNFGSTNSYHAVSPRMTVIDIDWKYNDTIGIGASQYAYLRITYENGSVYQVHYYFGRGGDTLSTSNTTGNYHVKMPGFGVRESWQHSKIDLYDAVSQLGLYNLSITGISFYSYAASVTGSAELLIDNFMMTTYPASDPTFEYDNVVGTDPPFLGWTVGTIHGEITKTTDSHTGLTACNMTSTNDYAYIYRDSLFVDFDNKLATDFWWKLNFIDSSGIAYVQIEIEFFDSYTSNFITYMLGRTSSYTPTDYVNKKHIEVEDFNLTGTWNNLHRNLTDDFESAFSVSSEGWIISGITLALWTAPGTTISCLFDDIHFKDMDPPLISAVDQSVDPVYYEVTLISVTASDVRPGISSVVLNYSTDGWSTWDTIDTTYETSTYDADIPAQPYGTLVQYYVIATDGCGVQAIDDNGGAYYSYTVGDDIAPTLDSPSDIEYTFGDSGHTIDWSPIDVRPSSYEVFVNDVSTYTGSWNDTSEHILLDVDGLAVGEYNFTCVVYDEAGNTAADTVIVTVVASTTTPTTSTTGQPADLTPLLVVVVVGAIGILLVVFVIMPKMKKS